MPNKYQSQEQTLSPSYEAALLRGALEDRIPARHLALDQLGQRTRRASVALGQHAAEFEQPLARGRIVERLRQRVVELGDDLLRRALWSEQRVPRANLVVWTAPPRC